MTQYLDFAEAMAERRQAMTMADWKVKLDAFLKVNGSKFSETQGKLATKRQ